MKNKLKFFLEDPPSTKREGTIVENDIIFVPLNTPTSHHGNFSEDLTPKTSSGLNDHNIGIKERSHSIFRNLQRHWLNEHPENRWTKVSFGPYEHKTQLYSGNTLFFLLKRFLVLSLSLKSSQKKNECFPLAQDFHIQVKIGEIFITPFIAIYTLFEEYGWIPHM